MCYSEDRSTRRYGFAENGTGGMIDPRQNWGRIDILDRLAIEMSKGWYIDNGGL